MSESVLINGATVIAGASSAVEAYEMLVPPEVDFRVECDQVHSVRFYVANADFSLVADGAILTAETLTDIPSTAGTNGNVYTVDPGSYDFVACVVTNDSASPASVTVAVGYDLVAEAATALFTVAEARALFDSGVQPMASAGSFSAARIIAAELTVRSRFTDACRVALIPTVVTEELDGCLGNVLRVSGRNPAKEFPRRALSVSAASIDGVALTATELAALKCHPDGRLVRTDGNSWSSSTAYQDLAVSVTYTHGWAAVPESINRVALLYAVRILAQGELPIGAQNYDEGGRPARFPYPGGRPHWTGDDEVDAILLEYEERQSVIA